MVKSDSLEPIALVIVIVFGGAATLMSFVLWIAFLMAADRLTEALDQPLAALAFIGLAAIVIGADILLRVGFDVASLMQPDPSGPSPMVTRYIPILAATCVAVINRTLARAGALRARQ